MGQSQIPADELDTVTGYTNGMMEHYGALDFESRAADEDFGVYDNLWLQQDPQALAAAIKE
ncbi:hypothetical protein J3459_017150 [Metarhizium acridum]|nr:hypothetical protein J3459_017150 [Metarhizium acridum]